MGLIMSSLASLLFSSKEYGIVMIGLDAAGKTTGLYRLRLGEVVTTIPTVGFTVESVKYRNISFTIWDIGGQKKLRALWRHYYHGVRAVVFVVDAADRERFDEVKEELDLVFNEDLLAGLPVLVYANKQDMPNAARGAELVEKLQLRNQNGRREWYVQESNFMTGDGLYEGLDWVAKHISKN